MKLQAKPLTALSIAQGILEYAVIRAFKKVFNSGSMKSACRAMTSVVPGLKLEFELEKKKWPRETNEPTSQTCLVP